MTEEGTVLEEKLKVEIKRLREEWKKTYTELQSAQEELAQIKPLIDYLTQYINPIVREEVARMIKLEFRPEGK